MLEVGQMCQILFAKLFSKNSWLTDTAEYFHYFLFFMNLSGDFFLWVTTLKIKVVVMEFLGL